MEIEVNRPKQYHDKIRDYTLWADSKKNRQSQTQLFSQLHNT